MGFKESAPDFIPDTLDLTMLDRIDLGG